MKYWGKLGLLLSLLTILISCREAETETFVYDPTPYISKIPDNYPPMRIPENNPLTVQGVHLGRKLFYDPVISNNRNFSCASCHQITNAFCDTVPFSTNIQGEILDKNTMPLFNTAFYPRYSWNGAIPSIEQDVQITISSLHGNWKELINDIKSDDEYRRLFYEAFGQDSITSDQFEKSISQFVRSIVSFSSRFDSIMMGEANPTLEEMRGFELFFTEEGDCFHCHIDPLFTNTGFHNNALDNIENMDPGFALVTGSNLDMGKFKVPSLRNLVYTAPYMHDGRFKTIREVIDFYSEGLQASPYADSNMKNVHKGGIQINESDKNALIAFLMTLTDHNLVIDLAYQKP